MKSSAFHILRVGIAITFLWVGVLIFRNPEAWGGFLLPWAAGILPLPLREAMLGTAVLDILIGFFLLIDVKALVFTVLAALHLVIVIIVVGVNTATVRDIGLLAGVLALVFNYWPNRINT